MSNSTHSISKLLFMTMLLLYKWWICCQTARTEYVILIIMNENALNVMSMLSLTRPSQPESHPELVYRFGYSVLPLDQYTGVSGVTF